MPSVRGCNLPDDLLYDVDNHIWFREEGDGNVKLGMTAVATAMAGKLVAYTPKRVGRSVGAGKSCGTLESGKWVGRIRALVSGRVVAANPDLGFESTLMNHGPYGAGWLAQIEVAGPVDLGQFMRAGDPAFAEFMAAERAKYSK